MTKQAGKEALRKLIEDFDKNESQYMLKNFQESEARSRFIDPFFTALGWELNQTGIDRKSWDVHREYSQRDNSATKKPDYAFRVNEGTKYREKFFVEAKAPHVDLKGNIPVFQAKRYAFSSHGKTPIVILTDFQTFRVFNGLEKPVFDNPLQGLLRDFDLEYHEYLDKWDALWDAFSKEAVAKGSLEQLIGKASRNVKSLDDEFLADISSWRETLARNVALRNKDLSADHINEAVQRVLDRLIFIRNLEDRGIGSEESLLFFTNAKEEIYLHLIPFFRRLDNEYNGQIFKEHFSETIAIDDPAIKGIIKQLYPPISPYAFEMIEPEILGRIYERFLGSKIRLTESHQAKVEEKPEVRHAGGVYYTPEYIVDYIVENTVGVKIKDKTPEEIESVKICDPACGSGNFLLGAFQYLIEYHREWYAKAGAEEQKKYKNDFYANADNEIQLTHKKKTEILKNNIFGVDIDREAVEVAIMSLYLKLLEEGQTEMYLPDITDNIKCGNSLIGTDFYVKSGFNMVSEELKKVNCFNWEKEFKRAGNREWGAGEETDANSAGLFDVVIGNPPYVFTRSEGIKDYEKKYYNDIFKHQNYQLNTFSLFIEQGYNIIKHKGRLGFIVPNNWLTIISLKPFRDFIVSKTSSLKIVNNLYKVFADANVDTSLLVFTKDEPNDVTLIKSDSPNSYELQSAINYTDLLKTPIIQISKQDISLDITQKIENNSIKLHTLAAVSTGIKAYQKGKGKPVQTDKMKMNRVFHSNTPKNKTYAKYLQGIDVKRNLLEWSGEYISYGNWLAEPRRSVNFSTNRILVRQIPSKMPYMINAVYVEDYYINDINSMVIFNAEKHDLLYILGVINSKAVSFWFNKTFDKMQRGIFPQFKVNELKQFPIPPLDLSQKPDKARHDALVSLVEKMLDLKQKETAEKSDHLKVVITRQIDVVDKAVDAAVYELYNLTADEIKVVEGKD